MKIRLYNAKIMQSPLDEIFSGEVFIENDKITSIVKDSGKKTVTSQKNLSFDRQIDCKGNLLTSGFCNAHTHSAMSIFRGAADDLSLYDWLNKVIFPLEAKLTEEDVYWGAYLQMAEYAKSGITAICDMYAYPKMTALAAKNANIALALCGGLNDQGKYKTDDVLKDNLDNYNFFNNKSERVKYFIGLHAEYTCSDSLIEQTCDMAAELNCKTYIHLSETLKEVGECSVRRNLTPAEYLHKVGYFDNGGFAAHCTYLDKSDMLLLKDKGVVPVINSASNLKLASGIPPVASMLANGLTTIIGTDSVASNNSTSMFKEMYLFSALQKAVMKQAEMISAEQALLSATTLGYNALGFNGGTISVGAFADIVLIDINSPNMQPSTNITKNLVYSADTSNVVMTIAGGKIIYENGNYNIGYDIYKLQTKVNNIYKKISAI